MSTDYLFTNKTNTEVKKLDLLDLNLRLIKRDYKFIEHHGILRIPRFRNKENPNKAENVSIYRYIDNYCNWTCYIHRSRFW